MKQRLASSLEALESRIAPAALSTAGVLSYVDLDGNHVSVTISKGTVAATDFTFSVANPFSGANADTPMQLEAITLAGSGFTGANIAVKVTKAGAGNGATAVGQIDAAGIDLGAVSVAGDLGSILAGSDGASNVAVKSLAVRSIGDFGEATQAAGSPTLSSTIEGQLGVLTVAADIAAGATIDVSDGANGGMGAITVGGLLYGEIESSGGSSGVITVKGSIAGGEISAAGAIAAVKVGRSIFGSNGGIFDSAGAIGSVSIGGSLFDNGEIDASGGATIGAVNIVRSIEDGGEILGSGNIGAIHVTGLVTRNATIEITGAGSLASVTIGGIFCDGSEISTSSGNIGPVKIGSDLTDGSSIDSGGALGAMTVGGNVFGGYITSSGTLGAIKIAGSASDMRITSAGSIASISVAHSVENTSILAGATTTSTSAVDIGAITVGGNWVASNVSAGVKSGASAPAGYPSYGVPDYGDSTDTLIAGSSTIASIVIGGAIEGNPNSGAHYGFDAESIGKFEFDHDTLKLPTTTPANIPLTPILGDVAIELV